MKGTVAFKNPILCMSRRISIAEESAILCFLSSKIDNHGTLWFAGRLLVTDRIVPAIVSEAAMVLDALTGARLRIRVSLPRRELLHLPEDSPARTSISERHDPSALSSREDSAERSLAAVSSTAE
jgi:hypothetical protein